jgi:hypothetical protein
MPSFTTPIHESNDCHNPPGPGGGQFCGKAKGAGAASSTYARFGKQPPEGPQGDWARSALWYDFGGKAEVSGDVPVAAHPLKDLAKTMPGGQEAQAQYLDSLTPPPPPGFTKVMRIADRPGLAGTNAANARGMTEFIDMQTQGDYSIEWAFQLDDNPTLALYTYYVQLDRTEATYSTRQPKGAGAFAYGR